MSDWAALLESIHSAWIDEIVFRHSKNKPELGLPRRWSGFAIPPELARGTPIGQHLEIQLEAGEPHGHLVFLADPFWFKSVHTEPEPFARSVLGRAAPEFQRRKVCPFILRETSFTETPALQTLVTETTRTIWMPLTLEGRWSALGLLL